MNPLSRRSVLRGMGATVALPFLEDMERFGDSDGSIDLNAV